MASSETAAEAQEQIAAEVEPTDEPSTDDTAPETAADELAVSGDDSKAQD